MNTGAHSTPGDHHMHEEPDRRSPAQAELRRRLDEGRSRARLNQTQLARNAGVSRTTVSKAFSVREGVPSVDTVTRLAQALKLPVGELLEIQRTAAEEAGAAPADVSGPGRPIGQWEPHELEVHPAGFGLSTSDADGVRALPGYVRREHDQVLADAVAAAAAGHSAMIVLVGTSSTGKTRACWQAVQALAKKRWRLWHPFDPTRAEAALADLHRVGPRTVLWLNEAQHYLGDRKFGEQIAAAVHQLLIDDRRGPVLVLGTLWPEYAHDYTALPEPGRDDPYSRVRELLAGRTASVPDTFDTAALAAATALAQNGDALLTDALTRNQDSGRITQDLAGAPELLRRYEQPRQAAARALLEVAMDARRLGVGLHLSQAFLTDAAPDYLSDDAYDQLSDDWAEQAYAELAKPVHGKQAPLRRTTPRPPRRPPTPTTDADTTVASPTGPVFRLTDYLEQHGRTSRRYLCPPASFWNAAHTHLTHPEDLNNLADAAEARHRLQWGHHLRQRAADHGDTVALSRLARMREKSGDRDGAEVLARLAVDHGDTSVLCRLAGMRVEVGDRDGAETLYREAADHGSAIALSSLAMMREEAGDRDGAEVLARQAVDHGDTSVLSRLAEMREKAGDLDGAETLYREAADHGNAIALFSLAMMRERAGDRDGAEALARQAADHRGAAVLSSLAMMRENAGDLDGAETLYREAVDHGNAIALFSLAMMREKAGDRDGAEALAREAADHGDTSVLSRLAEIREKAGDLDGAETLYREAVDHGNAIALFSLAMMREEAGDRDGAEALAREAADHGDTSVLSRLAEMREEAGDRDGAEALAREATDHGDTDALSSLAMMREEAGDRDGAEALAREATDHGDTDALSSLAMMREVAGDRDRAESLARQAADRGNTGALYELSVTSNAFKRLWPYGLAPDGTPTSPWRPSVSIASRCKPAPPGAS
ncbi:helix-turn-helix domain-containing protein [Leifsonia sp. NPDC102414]|uniref:helix-turn-helix domain-containing protein n=1 Tax=Leifsonia sp. NPDC102414 TaxID=3364124 RepID=UPI00382B4059